jgi:hypothetical protein
LKLSDVKGERTLDVVAACLGPVYNIGSDPKAAELFRRKALPKGMTPMQALARRVSDCLPSLLQKHKSDLIAILSAIQGVSPEQYVQELNLKNLLYDLTELLTDQDFETVFPLPAQTMGLKPSGGASENTGGPAE